jgi:hypothetical protein
VDGSCTVLNGQLASPSDVWQAARAQLCFQMMHDTYGNWLAATRRVGLDEDGRTPRVPAANQYAVGWLSLRLKRQVLRTLHDLAG